MDKPVRPLWQRFVFFLIPLTVSNILQSLSGTINNIYLGQMLGVKALAAVSVFFPVLILLIGFVVGLASGSAILIGQAFGAKNFDKIREVTGTTFTVSVLMGIVTAVLGTFFARDIMSLLGAPADILDLATGYGQVMLMGMPGFFLFLVITSTLRGVGDTTTPLISLILSIIVSVVVTPALIEGWWGLPKLGVLAAAWAFIAGFLVVLVFLYFYLNARNSPMAVNAALLPHLKVKAPLLGLILKLGLPAGLSMVVSSISAIVIIGIVNSFGSGATAAYGAVNQVLSYIQFPSMSIMIASSIFAAQAIGARRFDDVERVTRTGMVLNTVVTGGLVIAAYLFSEHIVRLFITDPAVISVTETLLHIVLWSCILSGYAGVLSAVMRASGDVLIPLILSVGAIVLVEIPAALILSHVMGLNGVWVAYTLSFSSLLILQAAYYLGFWRKKEIKALV